MPMLIGIIGYGTVGKTIASGFKAKGHSILINDINPQNSSHTKKELMKQCDIIFICTPSNTVETVIKEINNYAPTKAVIAIKSTVTPGTTRRLAKAFPNLTLICNPEFLRQHRALDDFLNPDRIVIGSDNPKATATLLKLYEDWNCPIFITDPTTAEAIKHFSNALLSVKVAYANEVKNICQKLGVNARKVMEGVCADHRFNPDHLDPDKGLIGGPCLGKDLLALLEACKEMRCKTPLLKATKEYVECPLCRAEKLTKWLYEDKLCWAAYCKTHPDKIIIVLKHHTRYPMPQEKAHLEMIAKTKFPNKKFRGPQSIKDHFHLHEV